MIWKNTNKNTSGHNTQGKMKRGDQQYLYKNTSGHNTPGKMKRGDQQIYTKILVATILRERWRGETNKIYKTGMYRSINADTHPIKEIGTKQTTKKQINKEASWPALELKYLIMLMMNI